MAVRTASTCTAKTREVEAKPSSVYTVSASGTKHRITRDRERAALAFTEAATLIAQGRVPDEVYDEARQHFSDEELVTLMLAIVTINAWNRFTIFGDVPGSYQPSHFVTQPGQVAQVHVTE